MTLIAPSILAADWGRINEEVERVLAAGADWLHMDVMDGQFVPPLTFGPQLVQAVRKMTKATLDVHLMVVAPERQLEAFRSAGADRITVHFETCPHLHRTVQRIHELGAQAGVAINPATSVSVIEPILNDIELVLVMTVNPGWGGQEFISSSVARVAAAKELISRTGKSIRLQVDGGINAQTAKLAVNAGADVLVAGTFIFGQQDYARAVAALRAAQTIRK